jgi:release factor glutamine methyltransferase
MPPILSEITSCLISTSDTPALDASVLLARILNKPRTWVMAHPELTLSSEQQNQLNAALARLENGEPFPYVLGAWEFFSLEFEVTPDVLIPRPETELLVEKAIMWMQQNPEKQTIADIGTGSGAIAVSLAVNLPQAHILATDISAKALNVAKQNASKHNVQDRIEFIECDLLPDQSQIASRQHLHRKQVQVSSIDLICANLPYIPTATLHQLPIFNREPTLALDGGDDGFTIIRRLLSIAPARLATNAKLLLEIEASLGSQAVHLAEKTFPAANIHIHQDLTGRDRIIEIQT